MPNDRLVSLLLNSRDSNCNSPLHLACIHNHIEVVRTLIEFGADLTLTNMGGQSAFHVCCEHSNLEILKFLFDASWNQVSVDWQMIEFAIKKDDGQMIAYLVSKDLRGLTRKGKQLKKEDIFDEAFRIKSEKL